MYEIFEWAAKVAPQVPRWLRRIIAVVGGSLAWGLARRARNNVTANVAQVLGPSSRHSVAGRVRKHCTARRIFCCCFENYLDLLALPGLTRECIVAAMDVHGAEHLKEALSYGRGVVLFSAHLGPFEYLPSWFSAHGYEMVIPVEKVSDERLLKLMVGLRRRNGVAFVPLDGLRAIRTMFETLRRNQIVLITSDRAIEGESVVGDFFGAPARLPRGPVDLSIRTGAPLLGAFGWRTSGDRMAAEFIPLTLALPDHERGNAEVLQAALTRELERIVKDHLDQWVVFEPIWAKAGSR
jgi:KDO2-lipid IV(A) lauroyltransferase